MTIFDWLTVTNSVLDIMLLGSMLVMGIVAFRKAGFLLRKSKPLPPKTAEELEMIVRNALRKP